MEVDRVWTDMVHSVGLEVDTMNKNKISWDDWRDALWVGHLNNTYHRYRVIVNDAKQKHMKLRWPTTADWRVL